MPSHLVKYSSRDYCIELIELGLILIDIFALSYPHRRSGARYSICRYGNTLVARFQSDSLLQAGPFCDFI